MTKNITLAIDEDVLQKVREIAAKEKTTVNAMVRQFLESRAMEDTDRERRRLEALAKLKELSEKSDVRLGKDWKFDRASLYDR